MKASNWYKRQIKAAENTLEYWKEYALILEGELNIATAEELIILKEPQKTLFSQPYNYILIPEVMFYITKIENHEITLEAPGYNLYWNGNFGSFGKMFTKKRKRE